MARSPKRLNVPNDATPDDIADTYLQAWKLGIKAVAIYRDGSKRTQPLNTHSEMPKADKTDLATQAIAAVPTAVRRRLPDERQSLTHKFSIGGHEGYLTVGMYPDNGKPGEIFIRMSKEGSSISGLMDSFATAISLALQYGRPPADVGGQVHPLALRAERLHRQQRDPDGQVHHGLHVPIHGLEVPRKRRAS